MDSEASQLPAPWPSPGLIPKPCLMRLEGIQGPSRGRGTGPAWVHSQRIRRNLPYSPFSPTRSPRAQGPPWAAPPLSGRIRRPERSQCLSVEGLPSDFRSARWSVCPLAPSSFTEPCGLGHVLKHLLNPSEPPSLLCIRKPAFPSIPLGPL